jgi:uncharacterized protein (TIGR00297 family)
MGWLVLGYLAAGLVGYLGYRAGALTLGGAIAACLVGGTIFGFGGLAWGVLLVLFFVSSSALSFFKAQDSRKTRAAETFEKGGRRDAAQVLANGGVAALLALLASIPVSTLVDLAQHTYPYFIFSMYAGALAAATADTWATEIGVLSKTPPRMLLTGRVADAGTSGAVTWLGSLAAIAGALFIGIAASVFDMPMSGGPFDGRLVAMVLLGGVAGSMFDSLLGATVQASYWCPQCNKATEARVHKCGARAELRRGLAAVNNDAVNFAATLLGAIVAGAIYVLV